MRRSCWLACLLCLNAHREEWTCLQVLTPKQEAMLDTMSYPWWPDLWTMADAASGMAPGPPPGTCLADEPVAGLPHLSAFEMLRTPMLALGAGLQLKRAWPEQVLRGQLM